MPIGYLALTTARCAYRLPVGRMRVAAAALTAVLLVAATAVSGCGLKDGLRDLTTTATQPFGRELIVPVDAPDANLANANNPVVAATKSSVVRIRGVSPSCQKVLEGSGFVVAPNRVMSTAHVVAGTDSVSVEVDGTRYDAQVVSYDPSSWCRG